MEIGYKHRLKGAFRNVSLLKKGFQTRSFTPRAQIALRSKIPSNQPVTETTLKSRKPLFETTKISGPEKLVSSLEGLEGDHKTKQTFATG
ncbi:hypothetical protein pfor_12c0934 [Rhodobacteraceae bacterium SB2]|nr:hypothetical protein pfor_12c0934 [Rhodobacteraceae bacterium SB2]